MSTIYWPIIVDEVVTLVNIPNRVNGDYKALVEIIGNYRFFLVIREYIIYFTYQLAKDFLIIKAP
jgi:hypothetical protein